MHKGSCLCGAVNFEVAGDITPPDGCHCAQCRKWSGHFFASADIPREALTVQGEVTWFHSSEKVRRGFCPTCGSSLFFDPIDRVKDDWIGVAMGAFESPTNAELAVHIFVAEKGDYYEVKDGLPQKQQ